MTTIPVSKARLLALTFAAKTRFRSLLSEEKTLTREQMLECQKVLQTDNPRSKPAQDAMAKLAANKGQHEIMQAIEQCERLERFASEAVSGPFWSTNIDLAFADYVFLTEGGGQ